MDGEKLDELAERIRRMSNQLLIGIVCADRARHSWMEVEFAQRELKQRGFTLLHEGEILNIITPKGIKFTYRKRPAGTSTFPDAATAGPADSDGLNKVRIDWGRIARYTVALFVTTFIGGFFSGLFARSFVRSGGSVPYWLQVTNGLIILAASVCVFVLMAYREQQRPLVYALLVGFVSWLLAYPLNVLLFAQPVGQWALSAIYLVIISVMGVAIGLGLRTRKEIAEVTALPAMGL